MARIREEDEQTILLLLTEGVDILRSVGQVFSTAAFDGMMMPGSPTVKVGLSIDSNLVEISPIADEVPMNEVGALLNSYRRNRRYHRFKDGTFVDLKNADLHELDQIATDLDLNEQQLDSGRITIPGFYDDVEEVPQAEREMIARIPFDEKKYKEAIGVKEVFGEKGYSTLERNSCRPSFDVCGIWGGYTGEGSKTVLPSKAYAKVSCRLVPHQNHHKISQMFADYILSIAPDTVQVKVTPMHGGQGYVCPISLPAYQAAEKGFEIAFGKKPLAVRRGGSIPIISTFEQVLGVKTVLMGFGLESDAIHSPNENFSLDIFRKGIEAVIEFHNAFR